MRRAVDRGAGLASFSDEFLVKCPACGGCARVARSWNAEHRHWRRARLTCTACGHARQAEVRLCCAQCPIPTGSGWVGPARLSARSRCARCGAWLELEKRLRVPPKQDHVELHCDTCDLDTRASFELHVLPLSTGAVDLCFGLPLWLQTDCRGETLWAFNRRHLAFLRDYLGATLRERGSTHTASAASRLPGWLKRMDRATVLQAVSRLERR